MEALIAIGLFLVGVVVAVWAAERLLEGLVGLAVVLRLAAFAVTAVLSGFELENVAVGLAAGARETGAVALGTVFGGAVFLVCVALGVGALLYPLEVRLPRGVLAVFALSPVLVGIGIVDPVTPRWAGIILLLAFVGAIGYLIVASRRHRFLHSEEVEEAAEKRRSLGVALVLTVVGLAALTLGGELVARGAEGMIAALGVPALLMGMVVTPAAIEVEEVARQAIPSRHGRHDISAGNLVGTLLYFLLFNLGLIALFTPVPVDPQVRMFDWPFTIAVTWLATAFLWRGRIGRGAGALLVGCYLLYIALHAVWR
jgi:cation:H+ antiporter